MKQLNKKEKGELLEAISKVMPKNFRLGPGLVSDPFVGARMYEKFLNREDYEGRDNAGKLKFFVPFSKMEIGAVAVPDKTLDAVREHYGVSEAALEGEKEKERASEKRGRGKGKKPTKQVTSVALDDDLIRALNDRAEREERTVSQLIRLAIKHYLECVK